MAHQTVSCEGHIKNKSGGLDNHKGSRDNKELKKIRLKEKFHHLHKALL